MNNKDKLAVVSGSYIAVQILSDILSLRILSLGGLSVDGGTLIYPLTFTIRDLLHRIAGKAVTRTIIITAAVVNLFMIFVFWIVSVLPPDMSVGPQAEFGMVLLPFWRIVIASILAEVISELLDGEIYEKWQNRYGKEKVWGRVLSSNLVSIPVDSAIFTTVAFLGDLPNSVVLSIFISNVLLKYVVGTISLPMIYATKD